MIIRDTYKLWGAHEVEVEFEFERDEEATYTRPPVHGHFGLLGVYTLNGEEITHDLSESYLQEIENFIKRGGK